MTTRAAKVIQAEAAAAGARKRKAAALEYQRLEFMKRFDATKKALLERHAHDKETRDKIIQGDTGWRKGGQAISGSEEGLYTLQIKSNQMIV